MSLDVYLEGETKIVECICSCCGNTHSRERAELFYTSNITHNLSTMAQACGLFDALWTPDLHGWTKAKYLIEPLRAGLSKLAADPEEFRKLNPRNGWGTYDNLIFFTSRYLAACRNYPESNVRISR